MASLNSVISDPEPTQVPKPPEVAQAPESDWKKLGKSKKFKDVNDYLEERKEHYRRFTPGGVPVEQLVDESARVAAWGQALCVINEIERIQATIAAHTT
jgi:hypothetical protein